MFDVDLLSSMAFGALDAADLPHVA